MEFNPLSKITAYDKKKVAKNINNLYLPIPDMKITAAMTLIYTCVKHTKFNLIKSTVYFFILHSAPTAPKGCWPAKVSKYNLDFVPTGLRVWGFTAPPDG